MAYYGTTTYLPPPPHIGWQTGMARIQSGCFDGFGDTQRERERAGPGGGGMDGWMDERVDE